MGDKDYGLQLEELRRKRDEVEDNYRLKKRHIEELQSCRFEEIALKCFEIILEYSRVVTCKYSYCYSV